LGVSGQEMFGFDCIVPSHSDNGKSVRGKWFDKQIRKQWRIKWYI
jgi:hypothetical protein